VKCKFWENYDVTERKREGFLFLVGDIKGRMSGPKKGAVIGG
jgi:hypothetical protein